MTRRLLNTAGLSAIAVIALALLNVPALAQTACPYGAQQGGAMCLPDAPAAPGPEAAPAAPRWRTTWGAIAYDNETGSTGTATGQRSEKRATQAAIQKCEGLGGRACQLLLAYHNQCVVIADPFHNGQAAAGGQSINQSAATITQATSIALSSCSEKNGGLQCRIVYSACSAPVLEN
ncbi:DUF4189 domain-containing protein [Sphingobium sp. BHU LFT2]|uniref:DUF4189 domain-containing protein n=1 Tax=Sphingobium sp. BHU LFT2 TaxID=2807634 RepID=UPI001BEB85A5|nr:DUF4189 domain-containing protein [Sphingobium sp. BHU LFT2]MBT2245806.1 DUF4189 domain-containing protein [Sphingobium sp. BHU LFT2]